MSVTCTKGKHMRGCHPAAPRCKWRRAKHPAWALCHCAVYHFSHRKGSGRCSDELAQAAYLMGLSVTDAESALRAEHGDSVIDEWLKDRKASRTHSEKVRVG